MVPSLGLFRNGLAQALARYHPRGYSAEAEPGRGTILGAIVVSGKANPVEVPSVGLFRWSPDFGTTPGMVPRPGLPPPPPLAEPHGSSADLANAAQGMVPRPALIGQLRTSASRDDAAGDGFLCPPGAAQAPTLAERCGRFGFHTIEGRMRPTVAPEKGLGAPAPALAGAAGRPWQLWHRKLRPAANVDCDPMLFMHYSNSDQNDSSWAQTQQCYATRCQCWPISGGTWSNSTRLALRPL